MSKRSEEVLEEERNQFIELKLARLDRICKEHGYLDVHGGPENGGEYWRGENVKTKRVEAIPKHILDKWNDTNGI